MTSINRLTYLNIFKCHKDVTGLQNVILSYLHYISFTSVGEVDQTWRGMLEISI